MRTNGAARHGFLHRVGMRFGRDIGIDLGTANTLVHVGGRGVLLREPSVVAINKDTGEVVAAGRLLDVPVLDHIVIGHDAYVSLRDRGVAFDDPGGRR